ncbi:hypothetical protein GGI15_001253 [Coemansia interrupta]|uniref:MIT domain-containing protein n=1 Tax=Coemansia interrupta TaxID=1126814 RepID=A0A9W8LMQ7_9FUNG|nr:hypothetical protein GGI15_001253 [Coemansia interrupta]
MTEATMRPSTAGGDSPLDLSSRNQTVGRLETDSAGPSIETASVAPSEATAVDSGNTGGGGGNNTRSFRFLLTLALRKAQTAVTLDNGGHVEEAIRTYREAISMLGLVLNRTSEEDGRQRLLHFRQTYSDRVSVLSSLRQPAAEAAPAPVKQQQQQQTQQQQEEGEQHKPNDHTVAVQPQLLLSPIEDTDSAPNRLQAMASIAAVVADSHSKNSTAMDENLPSPEPTPTGVELFKSSSTASTSGTGQNSAQLAYDGGLDNSAPPPETPLPKLPESLANKANLTLDLADVPAVDQPLGSAVPNGNPSTAKTKVARLKSKTTHQSSPLSPVILNKPLPPLTKEAESPPMLRKVSGSSVASNTTDHTSLKTSDDGSSVATRDSPAGSPSIKHEPALPELPLIKEVESSESVTEKEPATNPKEKDLDKANRRQSIKSQRSLPAMFGIGLKSRPDKAVPPVPQLPIGDVSSTGNGNNSSGGSTSTSTSTSTSSNIGRRLFGALRSNSNSAPTPDSSEHPEMPQILERLAEDATGDTTVAPGNSGDSNRDASYLPNSLITTSIEDIVMIDRSPDTAFGSDTFDVPPPTPSKDRPRIQSRPLTRTSSQSRTAPHTPVSSKSATPISTQTQVQSPSQTLTREQKRQSKATHRLVGLFKRNPSIPDIPSPVPPQKTAGDASKSGLAIVQSQSVAGVSKNRRLSSSASTPNLIEAAAAAASSDQQALAVYAATERGDIPPMPAPPTLRPSISSTSSYAAMSVDSLETGDEGNMAALLSARTARGGSISDALSGNAVGSMKRIEDHIQRQQQQQNGNVRPSLRIATKSAGEVLTFVPEHTPLPSAPMTANIDGSIRGRKSSVAAVGSQSITRSVGLSTGISSSIGSIIGLSSGSQSSQSTYGRPTLADVEEDQRLDMFEPSFGTFHLDLGPPPPKSSPLSPLWFISTLHRSMVTGGAYITTSLYVPRRLWFQTGIRIAAIETKLGVLAQLTQSFTSIGSLLSLPDIDMLLSASAPSKQDERLSETTPWESEDHKSRNTPEKDSLHKSCVALHHWLNNLEENLESNRRLLSKKLKFVSPSNINLAGQGSGSSNPLAAASNENLQASLTHLPLTAGIGGSFTSRPSDIGGSNQTTNASFPNLTLSNGDMPNSRENSGIPMSPLSPVPEPVAEMRVSDLRPLETPTSLVFGGIGSSNASILSMSRDQLSKDQMANARFKGLGKLGKSVDRIYSNMQKEKLDDTTTYVVALQRLFEAMMVLENLMHYFSRVAGDAEISGWFTDVPQSPVSLAGKRPHHRAHGESGSRGAASPSITQATLTSEPSVSSIGSVTAAAERKSSNASISVASAANASAAVVVAEKKNRRRSNYFSQRQNSNGYIDPTEAMPGIKQPGKPRSDSFSSIPRVVPIVAAAAGSTTSGAVIANARFVLPLSPIKTPMNYVQQGMGRAPGVIYARLIKVSEWLNQVLLAWVVRDLQVLYAKYIKRLREWVIE